MVTTAAEAAAEAAAAATKERKQASITAQPPPYYFNYNYLDYDIRMKVIQYLLKEGKPLFCHHRNCPSFDMEFLTLYDYNMHCHRNHPKQALHPSMQFIIDVNTKKFLTDEPWQISRLEPRGNPWE